MRFHEQLKRPTTAAHDRAVAAVMRMPLPDVLAGFFPTWDRNNLNFVELRWFPEEPVREPHRGNLVGFIDLAALISWTGAKERYSHYIGIEVKTSDEPMGNAVRQVKTYRNGLVLCPHIPMTYGQVDRYAVHRFQLQQVALALPQDEITEDVRLLATGVPLIAWDAIDEFAALEGEDVGTALAEDHPAERRTADAAVLTSGFGLDD